MARGMMERVLNPSQLDQWFNETAEQQYTKDLMFSTVFDVMRQGCLRKPELGSCRLSGFYRGHRRFNHIAL